MRVIVIIAFLLCFSNKSFSQDSIPPINKSIGVASFYAKKFNGRKTSSGEKFSNDSLTAAHKKFKFGTYVLVRNLKNDSTVIVKINDRLPQKSKRTIDLTFKAAKQLNFIKSGLTKVEITVLDSLEKNSMTKILIKNATIVNEDETFVSDVLIEGNYITQIDRDITDDTAKIIDASGLVLMPGAIDDQVHFREPGLTHKGEIYTEAKAAVAGGITSYMEMPNTVPQAVTILELEKKYSRAKECSLANYSFFMGGTNVSLEETLKVDYKTVCGLKLFMGSSTGDMLVDNEKTLEGFFSQSNALIATHCEFDPMVKENQKRIVEEYGEDLPAYFHPIIRNDEVCFKSSSFAVALAKKYNTRLHILHISTAKELDLFTNKIPLKQKRITAEACIHHLWFNDDDYKAKGNFIKWNPSVKTEYDRAHIFEAVLDGRIDVIATDHAPHTLEEKQLPYLQAPSGGPLVQHSILAMLEFYKQKKITLEKIVRMMSHNVADIFKIEKRGFIREGYFADLVLVDLNKPTEVTKASLLYKCGWSPFEGTTFSASINKTFVSGHLVYDNGTFDESKKGERLSFKRD